MQVKGLAKDHTAEKDKFKSGIQITISSQMRFLLTINVVLESTMHVHIVY